MSNKKQKKKTETKLINKKRATKKKIHQLVKVHVEMFQK